MAAAANGGTRDSGGASSARLKPKAKLSYKDQRELAALPQEIEALEREQSELNTQMSSPDYHRRGPDKMREDRLRSEQIEALLLAKFERWEKLEEAGRASG
jgi:ATP-binding cassette subfamily F protein uup